METLRRRVMTKIGNYLTFVAVDSGTFKYTNTTGNSVVLDYSLDNGHSWTTLANDANTPTIAAGDRIMWRGTIPYEVTGGGAFTFSSSGRFNLEGNILSVAYGKRDFDSFHTLDKKMGLMFKESKVVDSSGLIMPSVLQQNYTFTDFFNGCTYLTKPPVLPATTLTIGCYAKMFQGCTSIQYAPVLPAMTIPNSAYYGMFWGSSLQTAPALPATSIDNNCYGAMFYNCASLTTVPSILPATTLAQTCYGNMFTLCKNITQSPELPAPTLVQQCYFWMFESCSNLNKITCLATDISATDATTGWCYKVKSSGTFTKASSMNSWSRGQNGIPTNWTVQNKT